MFQSFLPVVELLHFHRDIRNSEMSTRRELTIIKTLILNSEFNQWKIIAPLSRTL